MDGELLCPRELCSSCTVEWLDFSTDKRLATCISCDWGSFARKWSRRLSYQSLAAGYWRHPYCSQLHVKVYHLQKGKYETKYSALRDTRHNCKSCIQPRRRVAFFMRGLQSLQKGLQREGHGHPRTPLATPLMVFCIPHPPKSFHSTIKISVIPHPASIFTLIPHPAKPIFDLICYILSSSHPFLENHVINARIRKWLRRLLTVFYCMPNFTIDRFFGDLWITFNL